MFSLIKRSENEKNSMFPEFPSLFDDVFTRDLFGMPSRRLLNTNTIPSVNVKETDDAYELEMAVPGMEKKDFKIELQHGRLVISAQRESSNEEKNEKNQFSRKEFSYESFSRSFSIPENMVDTEAIKANYQNGILNIVVPKKEKSSLDTIKEIKIS